MSQQRDFDIVVWGATGFTGTLVAEYLCESAASSLRWAIAGRNMKKLEDLRDRLALTNSKMKDLRILIGDINDPTSVDKIASSTRVLLNTVGPYTKMGTPVVDACVRKGTDYVDCTGELPWVAQMIERYHKIASEKEIKIVHSCGMQSVPTDLGVLMMVEYIKNNLHKEPKGVRMVITKLSGGGNVWSDWSGGTLNAALEMNSNPKMLYYTYKSLVSEGPNEFKKSSSIFERLKSIVTYDEDAKSWTIPSLVSAPMDIFMVERTAHLTEFYGPYFNYDERMAVPSFILGWTMIIGMLFALMLIVFPVTRWILSKVIPSSGSGPSRETMKLGYFKADLFAETYAQDPSLSQKVKGSIHIKGHPGYQETAKLISESAIALVLQKDLPRNFGVTTPAAAIGMPLVSRLRKAGVTFDVQRPSGSG